MITYFIDFIYGLSIVGILAGIVLVVDGMRRLKEQTTEPPSHSGPQITWIYWQKPGSRDGRKSDQAPVPYFSRPIWIRDTKSRAGK